MGNPQEAGAGGNGKSSKAGAYLTPGPSSSSSSSGAGPSTAAPPSNLDLNNSFLDSQPPPDEPLPSYEDSTALITTNPAAPPPTATTTGPVTTDAPPLPPPFSIYKPTTHKHYLNSHLITHDPHLNTDGESLYRFLLEENKNPPIQHVQIQGTHQVRTTVYERDSEGRSTTRTETRSETDFSFRIDLTPGLLGERSIGADGRVEQEGGVLRVFGDDEKIYRGGWRKTRWEPSRREERRARGRSGCCGRRRRCRRSSNSNEGPESTGLLNPSHDHDLESEPIPSPAYEYDNPSSKPDSAHSIREWADRYCHLPTTLKEFIVYKNITQLNKPLLTDLLTNAVRQTGYRGTVHITYPKEAHKVAIYPDSTFAKLRNNPWVRWFFYLTFLWIFTWPLLFLFTRKFHVVVSEWRFGRADSEDGSNERHWAAWWGRAVMYAARGRRRDNRCLVEADRVSAEEHDRSGSGCLSGTSGGVGGIFAGLFSGGVFGSGNRSGNTVASGSGILSNVSVRFGGRCDGWGADESW